MVPVQRLQWVATAPFFHGICEEFWLMVAETWTCLGKGFVPLTDRKCKSFTLTLCLCPGNKPVLVKTAVSWGCPHGCHLSWSCWRGSRLGEWWLWWVGIRECPHSLRRMLGSSKLGWIGKVAQKWKFCASTIGKKAAFCTAADWRRS